MATDLFRPHRDPAQGIYDAFVAEAANRRSRPVEEWIRLERHAVLKAAVDLAQRLGLRTPTLEEVERAEQSAQGHTDYGAKWAYRVAEAMVPLHLDGHAHH